MFNIFINKFKEICPFYRPCQPVLYTASSRSLMAKRAIFWLFLVELFMGNSLGSQLSSSTYIIGTQTEFRHCYKYLSKK